MLTLTGHILFSRLPQPIAQGSKLQGKITGLLFAVFFHSVEKSYSAGKLTESLKIEPSIVCSLAASAQRIIFM